MSNFIQAAPNQPLLLPVDLREWVPADDMVHFVLEAVEQLSRREKRKNKGSEYRQSYNAQAAVSTDGSQMVVGNRISQPASDRNEWVADVESVPDQLGRISGVLADSG